MIKHTVIGVRRDKNNKITHYVLGSIDDRPEGGLGIIELTVNEAIMTLRKDTNKINNLTLDSDNHTIKFAGVSEKKYVNFNDSKSEEYTHYTYVLAKETLNNKTIYHTFTVPDLYNKYAEAALISLSGYGKVSLVNAKIINKNGKKYISAMKNTIPVLHQESKGQKEKIQRQVEDSRNTRYFRLDTKLKKKLESSYVDLVTHFNEKGEIAGRLDDELIEAYTKRIKERLRKENKQFEINTTDIVIGMGYNSFPLEVTAKFITITVDTNKGGKKISFGVTGYYSELKNRVDTIYKLQEIIIVCDKDENQEDIQRKHLKSFKRDDLISEDGFVIPIALEDYLIEKADAQLTKYIKHIDRRRLV